MLRIIRAVNANANDSHVDYHMHFGIDVSKIRGGKARFEVLTDKGLRIMPLMTLEAEIDSINACAVFLVSIRGDGMHAGCLHVSGHDLSDHVATIGVPMRSEKNGTIETEV